MVIINSPSNPTGAVYTREELEQIAEVAVSEDIVILSDEIYEKLIYDDVKHFSIAEVSEEVKELTIVVNGFSKAYSMTGWRLGYTAANPAIAEAIANVQSHTTSAPTTFAQYGAIAALVGDQSALTDMREEYDMRRQHGRAAGRVLLPGEHSQDRSEVGEFLRQAIESLQGGGGAGHCVRSRLYRASLVCYIARRHQRRSRQV